MGQRQMALHRLRTCFLMSQIRIRGTFCPLAFLFNVIINLIIREINWTKDPSSTFHGDFAGSRVLEKLIIFCPKNILTHRTLFWLLTTLFSRGKRIPDDSVSRSLHEYIYMDITQTSNSDHAIGSSRWQLTAHYIRKKKYKHLPNFNISTQVHKSFTVCRSVESLVWS